MSQDDLNWLNWNIAILGHAGLFYLLIDPVDSRGNEGHADLASPYDIHLIQYCNFKVVYSSIPI